MYYHFSKLIFILILEVDPILKGFCFFDFFSILEVDPILSKGTLAE